MAAKMAFVVVRGGVVVELIADTGDLVVCEAVVAAIREDGQVHYLRAEKAGALLFQPWPGEARDDDAR
jgi:hypothetical protein